MSDYYEVLGVSRDASDDEIKKAYRKLARKLHPDVAGADSEDAFKEVTAAYQTLSDPEKRRRYDMGGDTAGFGGAGMGDFGGFSDIFETFFGGATQTGPVPRGRPGPDTLTSLTVSLDEVVAGCTKTLSIATAVTCPTCHGSCCTPGTSPRTCDACGGRGSVQRMARSFFGQTITTVPCTACAGHGTIIPDPCAECGGEGRVRTHVKKDIRVPAGIKEGVRLRMSGEGEAGPGGGPAGDLYIEVHVKAHPVFQRSGDDLVTTVRVPMTAAVLGETFTLDTFDGVREVSIPAGTQPGDVITLRGLGVGVLHRDSRGDLRIRVEVVVPRNLDANQRGLIEEFARSRGDERVEPKRSDEGDGVFSRLRNKFAGRA
ncbi:molecular chaperone DnaJ [Nanchangia anserum]|uniref:Chaperone protein DnaJ n=1 Tax=Nanchangia anserum TaxID=2692125 RepID=A0A8I0KTY0_9ACTO|nr:molecular chaperone DnaJ [Nanchangia anserum]MBD3689093.1 molecular chaperone DnaJ [Nanchangia anserum]QOX81331.1 molecular chaperone DnaJ [Nanchangia anserum]